LRLKKTSDLKDGYIDDFEDQSRLIGWENWLLIIGLMIYGIEYSDTDLVFDVHNDYWVYKLMDQLYIYS